MTTPLAPPDTGLSWVTFRPGGDRPACHFTECPAEATHLGVYTPFTEPCGCPDSHPYCLAHRDLLLELSPQCDGLFRCVAHPWVLHRLLRMEALR